jgi:hypothetical protein
VERSAIDNELRKLERKLLDRANRRPVELTRSWSSSMPEGPGVYAWFEGDQMIYVGESGCLRDRCNDSRRTHNHTLRRSIGAARFATVPGYAKASSRDNFPLHIEAKLNEYMGTLCVSAIQVLFGRSELEEYLIAKHEPRYNSKKQRGNRRVD